ncbi:MAG TPA: 50S ribosomal protein L29 [Anaerolineae bacterium]|nr:50S ribosomal protein L29 [Anaerolineae bacterium]
MQASELRNLDVNEIKSKLDSTYQELFNLRFQWASGQLEDHTRLTALRRDIARMKTILRERELAALAQGAAK